MDDDIDIYEDLPSFEAKECQVNNELSERCLKLTEENTKLEAQLLVMSGNMSSLMKTAKAEIVRKDRMIAQLRRELDDAAFRRGGYGTRKKQNVNHLKDKESDQNTGKKEQAPTVREEASQENIEPEWADVLDNDTESPSVTNQQNNAIETVFGKRLRKKILLEQEAERLQKEEARIASSVKPIKVEEDKTKKCESGNGFVEKEEQSQDTLNASIQKKEITNVSSLPCSTSSSLQLYQEDEKSLCHRRVLKTNLSEKREFAVHSEHKRRRIEEDRYRREDMRHHNGNFKYDDSRYNYNKFDDSRYNFESIENYNYSKIAPKYTDHRRTGHNKEVSERLRQVRGERSKSIRRSNSIDQRYNERRPDRHRIDKSRAYNDKYDKRREDGHSREGDSWTECDKELTDLCDKIESKVSGRSEYNNYNNHQLDRNFKKRAGKSRSPEKSSRSRSSGRSRDKEFDKRRSKRSRSTDKLISVKTTVESGEEPRSTRAPSHTSTRDSKDVKVEWKDRDAQPEALTESSRTSPRNEETSDKIASSEVVADSELPCTEEQGDLDRENAEAVSVTLEKLVSQVETPDKWIAALANDSEVALIPSAIPEPADPGSRSYREEKIENIEKFIQDYEENEQPCLPTGNKESEEEREKCGNSTSSIVDTLSMDIEDCSLDKKLDHVAFDKAPDESRMDIKDVAGESESATPKLDTPTGECPTSQPLQTLDDKQISATPEISEIKADTEQQSTDKVVGKQVKHRSRIIPCISIASRYSRKKPSVLADSGASNCIVRSKSLSNTEADNNSKEELKTPRIPMEDLSVQSTENSTNKPDSEIGIPKKLAEDANSFTGKTLNVIAPETTNATDDFRTREDHKIENSENSISVPSSGNDVLRHQTKTSPEFLAKVDAAPKVNNVQGPVELQDTHLAVKTILARVLSTDGRLSKRKRALPKEVDSQAKPAAKQCKIIVTARRRRRIQLDDSCIATTLVSSVHDVHWNESVKTICVKAEKSELPKFVSEPAVKRRKLRLTDK